MSQPTLHRHPSLESSSSLGTPATRQSLFDSKDDFIGRAAPISMAAIYFGSFSLAPQDAALARQALYKLSFVHRHFLQASGLRIAVHRQTACLSGTVARSSIVTLAHILAHQIEGIVQVTDESEIAQPQTTVAEKAREAVQLLFALDQTLRSIVKVRLDKGRLLLEGTVATVAQKNWAEQIAKGVTDEIESLIEVSGAPALAEKIETPTGIDDESLQALVLFRLSLLRETEQLAIKVKANRGILSLVGKVRTEALRQRVENIARSTLGLVELRSSVSVLP